MIAVRALPGALAAVALASLLAATAAMAQERGPLQLFPDPPPEEPMPEPELAPRLPQIEAPPVPERAPEDVRAVLRVEELAAPGIDAVGLDGGLGAGLWQGMAPEVVAAMIARLPAPIPLAPVRDLARRLLITGAAVEGGGAHEGRVLRARLERLRALGAIEDAAMLLAQLPAADDDDELARLRTDLALLAGDRAVACAGADAAQAPVDDLYRARLDVFCRLLDGDLAAAQLGISLLFELGDDDDAFYRLAEVFFAGGADSGLGPFEVPSALHLAMLRETGVPAAADLGEAEPAVLAAIARSEASAPSVRLRAAERAALAGALDAQALAAVYRAVADGELEPGAAATRAHRIAAIAAAKDDQERAEILRELWRDEPEGPMRLIVAEAAAPFVTDLAPSADLAFAAPEIAHVLIAAGRAAAARRWLAHLDERGAEDPAARSAHTRLQPLILLLEIEERPPDAGPVLAAWRQVRGRSGAAWLYALAEGLGIEVPASLWQELALAEPVPIATMIAETPLWFTLEHAARDGRLGLSVLSALRLVDGRPEEAHPVAVARALQALRALGLDPEARRIALATAIAAGL